MTLQLSLIIVENEISSRIIANIEGLVALANFVDAMHLSFNKIFRKRRNSSEDDSKLIEI